MRKLLVASQKGGVGKSTTSMNLAAAAAATGTRVLLLDADPLSNISTALNLSGHPNRRPLRLEDIDLPGVLVPDLVPGLDVLSPYDEGLCSDAELDRLLHVLASPAVQRCYGSMIVDVPPFLGGNPTQLLGCCDDFLLVMRAEALAHRTLPAFLEMVQRASRKGHALPMRGILLTLPEGEEPGCRSERELRGRFGARVLAEVIPHDAQIGDALRDGRIGSHAAPDSPAGQQYHQLASTLSLNSSSGTLLPIDQVLQALREAVGVAGPSIVAAPASVPEPAAVAEKPKVAPETPRAVSPSSLTKPPSPPVQRTRRSSRSAESPRPARPERTAPTPAVSPVRIKVVPAKVSVVEDSPRPAPPAPAAPQPNANALAQLWPLWILLGAVLGGGLRFLPLTASLLPILVGLGVALLVIVVLLLLAAQDRVASGGQDNSRRTRTREPRKTPSRTVPRPSPVADRLTSLAGVSKRARRNPDAN